MNNATSGFYVPGRFLKIGGGVTELEWISAGRPVPTNEQGFDHGSSLIYVFNFSDRPMLARISEYNKKRGNQPQDIVPKGHPTQIDTKFIPPGTTVTFIINPGWMVLGVKRTFQDSNGHNYGTTQIGDSFRHIGNKCIELTLDEEGVVRDISNQLRDEGWAKIKNITGVTLTLQLIQHAPDGIVTSPAPSSTKRLDTGGELLHTVELQDGEVWNVLPPAVRWKIQFLEVEPTRVENKTAYIFSEYQLAMDSYVVAAEACDVSASTVVGCFNSKDGGKLDAGTAYTQDCRPVLASMVVRC